MTSGDPTGGVALAVVIVVVMTAGDPDLLDALNHRAENDCAGLLRRVVSPRGQ